MSSSVLQNAKKQLEERTSLGFWIYLMTDCMLFATLFVTFIVLRNNTAGGPSGADIFEMPIVLTETVLLLTSSLACGVALLGMKYDLKKMMIAGMIATYVLGLAFLAIELYEFSVLASEGFSWQRSAFLSAFFTLVGTHGLHIFFGLLWLIVLGGTLLVRGVTTKFRRQMVLFGLYWHFLDIVWVFIFTFVYLMGVTV